MSKRPKLEFFKIHLNPIKSVENLNFREIIKKILREENEIKDRDLLKNFFQLFFKTIDEKFINDKKKNKAFYAKNEEVDGVINKNVSIRTNRQIIEGIIKGGSYNTGKEEGDINAPRKRSKKLGDNTILLDNFYFLLHTPLDKNIGILVIQGYTKDQVGDIFKPFIERLFKIKEFSLKANMTPFMPKEMQERFLQDSVIKKFDFTNRFLVNDISEGIVHQGEFTVKVEIQAVGKSPINIYNFSTWKQLFGNGSLSLTETKERSFKSFNKRRGYVKEDTGKSNPTKFELDDDSFNIKPTLYLEKYIEIGENGTPNWTELKKYTKRVLEKIIYPEVYPEDYIDED